MFSQPLILVASEQSQACFNPRLLSYTGITFHKKKKKVTNKAFAFIRMGSYTKRLHRLRQILVYCVLETAVKTLLL